MLYGLLLKYVLNTTFILCHFFLTRSPPKPYYPTSNYTIIIGVVFVHHLSFYCSYQWNKLSAQACLLVFINYSFIYFTFWLHIKALDVLGAYTYFGFASKNHFYINTFIIRAQLHTSFVGIFSYSIQHRFVYAIVHLWNSFFMWLNMIIV